MTFAELLVLLLIGYAVYRLLGPVQRRLEYIFAKFLRRAMGSRPPKPVIDITSRKER